MNKKYKLLRDEKIIHNGRTLYRIFSLKRNGSIPVGYRGGYIESEANLSHDGICFVHQDAKVYGNAVVVGDAQICNQAEVFDSAYIGDNAIIGGNAKVYGMARVYQSANVSEMAEISGEVVVYGNARVCENAIIKGMAQINNDVHVYGSAIIQDRATLSGKMTVYGCAVIKDRVTLGGRINIGGCSILSGKWHLFADIDIRKGNWEEPPIIMYGSKGCIFETKPNRIRWGSITEKIERWQSQGWHLFSDMGLNKEQSVEYRTLISTMAKLIRKRNKRIEADISTRKRSEEIKSYHRPTELAKHFEITADEVRQPLGSINVGGLTDLIDNYMGDRNNARTQEDIIHLLAAFPNPTIDETFTQYMIRNHGNECLDREEFRACQEYLRGEYLQRVQQDPQSLNGDRVRTRVNNDYWNERDYEDG